MQKTSRTRFARGFTLLEVIMVIVIVSILSVAALPLLSGSSDQAAKLEAAQIETTIRRAQTLARAEQTEYQAVFCTADGTITVSKKGGVGKELPEPVPEVGAQAAKESTGGTGGTTTTTTTTSSKSKLIPEGGGLTVIGNLPELTMKVEESFVFTLEEGTLTSVDFGGSDTLYFDTTGDVTAGGTVRVDYSDLYMIIAVATKTGAVTVTETWK